MPIERKIGLYANIEQVQAQRIIRSGRLGKYKARDAYDICLAAGKSKAYAEQTYSDLRHAEMENHDKGA